MARGTIKEGENTILENIEISLTKTGGSHQLTEWYGSFRLAKGNYIDPGGPYQLVLDDGRSGEIIVVKVRGSEVQFQGSGELKKPEPPQKSAQGA